MEIGVAVLAMELFSALPTILLTLVGYSAGSVLGRPDREVVPELPDLVVVVALWTTALAYHTALGPWLSPLTWLVVSGLVSAFITVTRPSSAKGEPRKEDVVGSGGVGRVRGWWLGWTRFAARLGNYQGRMFMAFFYFLAVTPFGLLARVFLDPLRPPSSQTFWIERSTSDADITDIEGARNQF